MNTVLAPRMGWVRALVATFLAICGSSAAICSPSVSLSASSLSLGSVNVNALSSPQGFTVTNNWSQNLTLQSVASNNGQFIVTGPALPMPLAAGQSAAFQVVFAPAAAGSQSATIAISVNRPNQKMAFLAVSGTGLSTQTPPPSTYQLSPSATSLNLGTILVGSTGSQSVTLSNTGNSNVTISQVAVTGAGFTAGGPSIPVTLSPGQNATLNVSFSPLTPGSAQGSVSVVSDATNSPAAIRLNGNGVQPTMNVLPNSVAFGSVTLGATSTQSVTVQNTGTANLTLTQAAVTGPGFGIGTLGLPLSIPPGGSTSLTITFTPASATNFAATLTLASNAPGSPFSVAMSGSGSQPAVHTVNLAWSDFSSATAGFNVYRGITTGGPYVKVNSSLVPISSYLDPSVQSGNSYYYVTTAVDSAGSETAYSNEAVATVP
jgi:hypothetical protein